MPEATQTSHAPDAPTPGADAPSVAVAKEPVPETGDTADARVADAGRVVDETAGAPTTEQIEATLEQAQAQADDLKRMVGDAETAEADDGSGASVAPSVASDEPEAGSAEAMDDLSSQFEDAQTVLSGAAAAETANKGEPASAAREPAPTPTLNDLDHQLAAQAQAAMNHDEAPADGPSASKHGSGPQLAATPTPAAGTAESVAEQPHSAPPSQSAGAGSSAAADTGGSTAAAPEQGKRSKLGIASKVASLVGGKVVARLLQPVAQRYARLGAPVRKAVALAAWGTLLQALALWAYLLFLRTAPLPGDPAAGAEHGAVTTHEAHGSEKAAEKGHGAPAKKTEKKAAEKGHH